MNKVIPMQNYVFISVYNFNRLIKSLKCNNLFTLVPVMNYHHRSGPSMSVYLLYLLPEFLPLPNTAAVATVVIKLTFF